MIVNTSSGALVINVNSECVILTPNDEEVQTIVSSYENRESIMHKVVNYYGPARLAKWKCLREVIDSFEPNDFYKLYVKITRFYPSETTEWTSPWCDVCKKFLDRDALVKECPVCSTEDSYKYIYAFQLVVEDQSTSEGIPIVVWGEEGENFFGVPACDLTKNNQSLSILEQKSGQALDEKSAQIAIVSYFTIDNRRKFQLFRTRISN
eukprot:TRINITY_DN9596_c0_g1_i1.p1 TRINITY_DN9596_c0_g1~~TRINITY_DN9596_c0_g1_i1.p1  ORF type:complete len:208 (-),score=40.67 TRINITY_DN9596_c0_g1_i1:41-664(-)